MFLLTRVTTANANLQKNTGQPNFHSPQENESLLIEIEVKLKLISSELY